MVLHKIIDNLDELEQSNSIWFQVFLIFFGIVMAPIMFCLITYECLKKDDNEKYYECRICGDKLTNNNRFSYDTCDKINCKECSLPWFVYGDVPITKSKYFLKEDITWFIDELPERIEWLKNVNFKEIISIIDGDSNFYYTYSNEWIENLNSDGMEKAKVCEDIVFDVLVDGELYKKYNNPMSYELTDEADKVRKVANCIYTYAIYLQHKNNFSDKAAAYCKQMEQLLKPVYLYKRTTTKMSQ